MIAPWAVDGVAPRPAGRERAAGDRRRGVARDEAQNHPANKALLPTCEYARGKAWAFSKTMNTGTNVER